jgi:hypothetical protein
MPVGDARDGLDSVYALSPDQIERYRANSHAKPDAVASALEVAAYRPSIEAEVYRRTRERRPLAERDTYGKAFLQVGGLRRHDEARRRLRSSPTTTSMSPGTGRCPPATRPSTPAGRSTTPWATRHSTRGRS